MLGACVAAAIFSNIAKLIDKLDAAGSRYSALLDSINEFGKFYRLPAQTRAKLHGYCAFLFAVNRGIDTNEVMSTLPPALQTEVLYTMHQHLVRQVPMFADTDDLFIKALVRVLKPQARRRRASRAEREREREGERESRLAPFLPTAITATTPSPPLAPLTPPPSTKRRRCCCGETARSR